MHFLRRRPAPILRGSSIAASPFLFHSTLVTSQDADSQCYYQYHALLLVEGTASTQLPPPPSPQQPRSSLITHQPPSPRPPGIPTRPSRLLLASLPRFWLYLPSTSPTGNCGLCVNEVARRVRVYWYHLGIDCGRGMPRNRNTSTTIFSRHRGHIPSISSSCSLWESHSHISTNASAEWRYSHGACQVIRG